MKNATPKLPLFSFFMFLFEKTPIRPRTSFLSGQKMPPCPGSWPGLPYLQSRKKRRKPLQLIFLRFTNRLRIWPKVTDESKKIDKHHRAPVDFGWVGGIRTLGGFMAHTRFPVVRLRPAQPSFHVFFAALNGACISYRIFRRLSTPEVQVFNKKSRTGETSPPSAGRE